MESCKTKQPQKSVCACPRGEADAATPDPIEPPGYVAGWSWFVLFGVVTIGLNVLFGLPGGWGHRLNLSGGAMVVIMGVFSLTMLWFCLRVVFRERSFDTHGQPPVAAEEYSAHGLGALPGSCSARELYLDLVKRAATNILYQDPALWFYDDRRQLMLATGFSLARRVMGEDGPTAAHTMIGIKRMNNIQHCVETVLRDGVKGDLVEAGVCKGGAAIFMTAILKVHGVTDRRVFACDTFVSAPRLRLHWLVKPIIQALASIPSRRWQRWCFFWVQNRMAEHSSFPRCEDPGDDLVDFVMWHLRHPSAMPSGGGTSIDEVKSHFARYGLLDDRVVFLKGFFADTLPTASLDHAAVIRLDGDTYESTRDGLRLLYPKLTDGGFCIIDDYHSYAECARAVHEYRNAHGITDEIVAIDRMAAYWRKGQARSPVPPHSI